MSLSRVVRGNEATSAQRNLHLLVSKQLDHEPVMPDSLDRRNIKHLNISIQLLHMLPV